MSDEFKPHSHVPYQGDGSLFYSDYAYDSYPVFERAWDIISLAIENVHFDKTWGKPFTIADYGTADGGVSMPVVYRMIELVRKLHGDKQELLVYYEDQITNDFNKMFKTIQGFNIKSPTHLQKYSGVFTSASATNFYSQCFPTASIHFGFSSFATHWMFKRPCTLKTSLHHTASTDENERKAFKDEAGEDWQRFLLQRAKELTPGGHMVIANLASEAADPTQLSVIDTMTNKWKSMVDDGIISQSEFEETTFNVYCRTEEECREPFDDTDSLVFKSGLRLLSVTKRVISSPLQVKNSDDNADECRRLAKKIVLQKRLWSNSTFLSGLRSNRSNDEKSQIVDELFKSCEDEVSKSPAKYSLDHTQIFVHFKKECYNAL